MHHDLERKYSTNILLAKKVWGGAENYIGIQLKKLATNIFTIAQQLKTTIILDIFQLLMTITLMTFLSL